MSDSLRPAEIFDRDAAAHGGYLYTDGARLSSRLATQRSTDLVLSTGRIAGRDVLDLGCGDGFYTVRFWDQGRPRRLIAVDAAPEAVKTARARCEDRSIGYVVADAHRSPCRDNSFEVVLLQSILHHDSDPPGLIREAFRLAPTVVIHEPNGCNFGLKVIERTSRYHIEHKERSYSPRRLRRWIEAAGGRVVELRFAGFVPMFCPDWLARLTKWLEPLVETLPLVRPLGCAVFTVVAERGDREPVPC